jgi:hypothetical protein
MQPGAQASQRISGCEHHAPAPPLGAHNWRGVVLAGATVCHHFWAQDTLSSSKWASRCSAMVGCSANFSERRRDKSVISTESTTDPAQYGMLEKNVKICPVEQSWMLFALA